MNNVCPHKKKQIHTAKQNNNEIYFNLYYYIRIKKIIMKPHIVAAINLSVGCFYAFSEVGTSYLDKWLKWGNID